MNAGEFDKKLTLQAPTVTSSHGENVESWATVATPWAKVEPVGASEYLGGGVDGETTYAVTIRYRTGVKSNMRFLYGDQVLNIVGPPMDTIESGTRVLQMSCVAEERG